MKERSKHQHLLEDVVIKRWYDNVARGPEITADVYLRNYSSDISTFINMGSDKCP